MVKVLQARAFMMIDEIFTTFLIQDIDPIQKNLKVSFTLYVVHTFYILALSLFAQC